MRPPHYTIGSRRRWESVEFAYNRTVRPIETIAKKWHEALIDAVEHNKSLKAQQRA